MQEFIATLLAYILHQDKLANPPAKEKKAAALDKTRQLIQENEDT